MAGSGAGVGGLGARRSGLELRARGQTQRPQCRGCPRRGSSSQRRGGPCRSPGPLRMLRPRARVFRASCGGPPRPPRPRPANLWRLWAVEEPSCFRFRAVRQFEREAGDGCFESLEDVASVQFKVPLNIQNRVWRGNNNQDLLSACPESDCVLGFLLALTYLIVTIRLCKRCFSSHFIFNK